MLSKGAYKPLFCIQKKGRIFLKPPALLLELSINRDRVLLFYPVDIRSDSKMGAHKDPEIGFVTAMFTYLGYFIMIMVSTTLCCSHFNAFLITCQR